MLARHTLPALPGALLHTPLLLHESAVQTSESLHELGQQKPVTVYRLISAGTVEEGIVSLHAEKRDLVSGVLEGSASAGAMSTEQLVELIRAGAAGDGPSNTKIVR